MHQVHKLNRYTVAAIVQAKEYIHLHPLDRINTDQLAEMVGIHRNVLQRGFKKQYGKLIKVYQFEVRMEASCQMLKDGKLTIKQVALKCGYGNPNNYSTAFKKIYKVTPSEWQEINSDVSP